jgi:phospholipase/carboxylesterase
MTTDAEAGTEGALATLWSTPEGGRADGQHLLVMLHDRGGKESDLFGLERFFLPDTAAVASLRAPLAQGRGYEWFAGDEAADPASLNASVSRVLGWLDALDFTPGSIGVMGYAQGGTVALQLLRQAPARLAYVMLLSGVAPATGDDGDEELAAAQPRVPVYWALGDQDDVLDPAAVERTRGWLAAHTALEEHLYSMTHTICQDEFVDMKTFAAEHR